MEPLEDLLDFAELPAGCLVLDVRARGADRDLSAVRRRHPMVCVDPSPERLLEARRIVAERRARGRWVRLLAGDPAALPFHADAFGASLSLETFHRLDDPEAVLAEMVRVVRPGGFVVIQDPLAPETEGEREILELAEAAVDPQHRRLLTADELCAHFAGERLEVVAHRSEVIHRDLESWLGDRMAAAGAREEILRRLSTAGGSSAAGLRRPVAAWLLRVPYPEDNQVRNDR